jgi:mono/diheme cytochrome c family protein
MPDPEPAYSPCAAILHAHPGQELKQPTSEELATSEPTPEPALSPTPTSTPAPTATPQPLEGTAAEEILLSAGCISCHQIGDLGEAHKVGPDLSGIGLLTGEALQGMSLEEYLQQALVDPNAVVATNCPNGPCLPNIMPRDYATRLDSQQIETLVAYLLTQQEEETSLTAPEPASNSNAAIAPKAFPAPKNAKRSLPASSLTSTRTVQILLLSLVFLLSLLLYFKGSADDSSSS